MFIKLIFVLYGLMSTLRLITNKFRLGYQFKCVLTIDQHSIKFNSHVDTVNYQYNHTRIHNYHRLLHLSAVKI